MMLLGLTAAAVAACFCLGPSPAAEPVPMAPDALTTQVVSDSIPLRCLTGVKAWSHLTVECPRMPAGPSTTADVRPSRLYRVR